MNSLQHNSIFTVPLPLKAHQLAQEFYQKQSNLKKAKQVYLNTLAVYAVEFYLGCLGVDTNSQASESWNPAIQTLSNIADLQVKDLGKLECRPVLPEEQVCQVPPEVWLDRIGYVAVRLNRALTQATLLGFVPTVNKEEIPLYQLKPLEELPEHLNRLKKPMKEGVRLSPWLHNIFETGWEAVESLFAPPPGELAFRFRSGVPIQIPPPENPELGVKRGKRLCLERLGEEVVLCVELNPISSAKINISVEVYPTKTQSYLPQDLQLIILDENEEAVMQAVARSTQNIQIKFSGEPGERFSVKATLGGVSVTEAFLV